MPPDVFYRGYRIVSDIQEEPGIGDCKVKAAVVMPADASGIERVHPLVRGVYVRSEKEASDFVLAEAKKWIDAECDVSLLADAFFARMQRPRFSETS